MMKTNTTTARPRDCDDQQRRHWRSLRLFFGLFLIVHGLAHTATGMGAQDLTSSVTSSVTSFGVASSLPPTPRIILATVLFFLAMLGFVAAGFGVWGVAILRKIWGPLTSFAVLASTFLIAMFAPPPSRMLVGIVLDFGALLLASALYGSIAASSSLEKKARPRATTLVTHAHRAMKGVGHALALGALLYLGGLVVLRPWHRDLGSTASERSRVLPGDERAGNPQRAGDRAIAIDAPASVVWPWLVQMGQDRGGFYSYASLENAVGVRIQNAEQIVPEWQTLREGDFIRATQPDWLGGVFGDRIGWEVDHLVPNRVLALRYWIFEVEPTSETTSRLHVRTHAGDAPVPITPLIFLVFEPAHAIMEHRMLVGIKERAEQTWRRTTHSLGVPVAAATTAAATVPAEP